MHDDVFDRLVLLETDLPAIAAGALVVEDDQRLGSTRGHAAQLDALHPELQAQRQRALDQHGGIVPLGVVVPGRVMGDAAYRTVVWVVTWTATRVAEVGQRATPPLIAQISHEALRVAVKQGAAHVVMPALGTRTDQHVLPPVPKKLPRYVMGAAQLAGIQAALLDHAALRVTVCLTQRDLAIWRTLLGAAEDTKIDD